MRRSSFALVCLVLVLPACSQAPAPSMVVGFSSPARDALLRPTHVDKGRLEYTGDYQTFAPVMTERAAYPTQEQANFAFERFRSNGGPIKPNIAGDDITPLAIPAFPAHDAASSIRVFACAPGAINPVTMRVDRFRGPVVHCATDLLDASVDVTARTPLNFYRARGVWKIHDPDPWLRPARWRNYEPSPPSSKGWLGDRFK